MSAGDFLLDLLEARTGIVCAVGAGGKKSLLWRLALAHTGRVAITATARIENFRPRPGFAITVEPDADLPPAVARLDPALNVLYACPGDKPQRHNGASPATIERIHREGRFTATYVKADGARMRLIKAPADEEPLLPEGCTTVLPILSARALGKPLTGRLAHRLERVEQAAGLRENEPITPAHFGRLLASPDGSMKRTEGRKTVPVINMVDDVARETLAREAAEVALSLCPRIDRVVLTCLTREGDPVVAVVRR